MAKDFECEKIDYNNKFVVKNHAISKLPKRYMNS